MSAQPVLNRTYSFVAHNDKSAITSAMEIETCYLPQRVTELVERERKLVEVYLRNRAISHNVTISGAQMLSILNNRESVNYYFRNLVGPIGINLDTIRENLRNAVGIQRLERTKTKTDCSVNGWEFCPDSALTLRQLNGWIGRLYRFLPQGFAQHKGCSNHIHLRIGATFHTDPLSKKIIWQHALRYLMAHQSDIPVTVLERIRSTDYQRFFHPGAWTDEKFSAVHYHGVYNTWEFRLFGNCQNASSARKCVVLATRALRYGYRQYHRFHRYGRIMLWDDSRFSALAFDAMNLGIPIPNSHMLECLTFTKLVAQKEMVATNA